MMQRILLLTCLFWISAYVTVEANQKKYVATLADGTTVELVGVRYFSIEALKQFKDKNYPWWKADGASLPKPPDTWTGRTSSSDTYVFVMAIGRNHQCSCKAIGPRSTELPVQNVTSKGRTFKTEDLKRFALRFEPDQEQATIRIGLATDRWQSVENWQLRFYDSAEPDSFIIVSSAAVILRCPEQKGPDVVAEVTHTYLEQATRLVIVDLDKKIHESEQHPGGRGKELVQCFHRFKNWNRGDIEHMAFQKRSYNNWITFKNVSLRPSHKTNVRITVETVGQLVGKPLPEFGNMMVDFSSKQPKGKKTLVCFWDMNQRPSRHCVKTLAAMGDTLAKNDTVVVLLQASAVDPEKLKQWMATSKVSFPAGTIKGDRDKILHQWGVKSLPWLILTDRNHIVRAEGFAVDQLNGQLQIVDRQ